LLAILEFLYELTTAFENRYFARLHRANRKAEKQLKKRRGGA